jgi:hypothetical protein
MTGTAALLLIPIMLPAQEIYHSPQFTVSSDRVTQGQFVARAISPNEIESNYPDPITSRRWKLGTDVSSYPQLRSPNILVSALYNLSLEELKKDIRPDGAFMAGAKWDGVWTRDISYSILLSLAAIEPEIAKTSLLRKVARGRIIQDTGTGGSWPCSTDRMTWALAAWEIYLTTGDRDWLAQSFQIIKDSAADDAHVVFSRETGMALGESSFLDWREQTYPRWMQPADIYSSQALGTNAVHFRTYQILASMAKLLGNPSHEYEQRADTIRAAANRILWLEDRGYYGQYLYGRITMSVSPRSEALGEALSILFDLAPPERQTRVLASVPVMPFGIPCIYPQIPGIPPYHNNAIWPFVQAYWNLAAAKQNDMPAVLHGLASIWRAAALFLTNQENMVADTGDAKGTAINSERQLWSVAGNLAMLYRVLFGMDFTEDGLRFRPVIPKPLSGAWDLDNFRYRGAKLTIHVEGFGSKVATITFDSHPLPNALLPPDIKGSHEIRITMDSRESPAVSSKLVDAAVSPDTPETWWGSLEVTGFHNLYTKPVDHVRYMAFQDGHALDNQGANAVNISENQIDSEFQVLAINSEGLRSFLNEPLRLFDSSHEMTVAAPHGPIDLTRTADTKVTMQANTAEPGAYAIDFHYANGGGPINTDNKCAIRTLSVDGKEVGPVVLPQRGKDNWKDFGYTNHQTVQLSAGPHTFTLSFDPWDENMNGEVNRALIDQMRLTRLR